MSAVDEYSIVNVLLQASYLIQKEYEIPLGYNHVIYEV